MWTECFGGQGKQVVLEVLIKLFMFKVALELHGKEEKR
jgi:hypothetical protein